MGTPLVCSLSVMAEDALPILGERLRALRERAGFSPAQLAAKVGVSENAIRKVESGLSKQPSFTIGILLADALGVTPHELAGLPDSTLPAAPGSHPLSLEARFDALATEVAEGFEEAGQTRLQFVRLVEILASEPGLPEKTRKRLRLVLQKQAS